jgi:hypothetical protein
MFLVILLQDIDTIYLSHDTKEVNLGDFDHLLDGKYVSLLICCSIIKLD